MVETTDAAPVLLYDGVCGFCNKTVQMILDNDRRGTLRFAALQWMLMSRSAFASFEMRVRSSSET